MSEWRVIMTDSESLTGVAPVCPHQNDYTKHTTADGYMREVVAQTGAYDCCPGPHIECGTTATASAIAQWLTVADAEVCS